MATNDPFAAVIAQAQKAEAERKAKAAKADAERKVADKLRREQAAATAQAAEEKRLEEERLEKLRRFGVKFLEAVALKVADPAKHSLDEILRIQAFAESLLCQSDQQVRPIKRHLEEKILNKFEYGLSMSHNQGVVPDGFFFGQRLLAERAAEAAAKEAAAPPKLKIVPLTLEERERIRAAAAARKAS